MDCDTMIHDMGQIRNELKANKDDILEEINVMEKVMYDIEDKNEMKSVFFEHYELQNKLIQIKQSIESVENSITSIIKLKMAVE